MYAFNVSNCKVIIKKVLLSLSKCGLVYGHMSLDSLWFGRILLRYHTWQGVL